PNQYEQSFPIYRSSEPYPPLEMEIASIPVPSWNENAQAGPACAIIRRCNSRLAEPILTFLSVEASAAREASACKHATVPLCGGRPAACCRLRVRHCPSISRPLCQTGLVLPCFARRSVPHHAVGYGEA